MAIRISGATHRCECGHVTKTDVVDIKGDDKVDIKCEGCGKSIISSNKNNPGD